MITERPDPYKVLFKATGSLLGRLVAFLINGLCLKYLFNTYLVSIAPTLQLTHISYVQALVIILVCGALFQSPSKTCGDK